MEGDTKRIQGNSPETKIGPGYSQAHGAGVGAETLLIQTLVLGPLQLSARTVQANAMRKTEPTAVMGCGADKTKLFTGPVWVFWIYLQRNLFFFAFFWSLE